MNNMILIWKPLDGLYDIIDNMYEINILGEVRNKKSQIILKPKLINSGYYIVTLRCKERKYGNFLLHRLLALKFIFNDDKNSKIFVNHKDGNKHRNVGPNLEWMTPKENNQHAVRMGLIKSGEDSHSSKLNNNQVHQICKLLEQNKSYTEILMDINMEITDNNRDMIGNIKRKKAWLSISKYYDF